MDSRLLATLAALSSQYSFRVTAFGDASPGVQALYREVTMRVRQQGRSGRARGCSCAGEGAGPSYLPAHATIVHPGRRPAALNIQFAAPSPLGLLTAVLDVDRESSRPARQ